MKKIFTILTLVLISCTASAQCNAFYDGFESGALLPQWQFGTGTYTKTVTTLNPAVGGYSFEQAGSSAFYEGTFAMFPSGQPDYISFRMRTSITNSANGYVVIGDNNTTADNGVIFCYFNSTSELRFYGTTGQNFPIVADQWYHVEVQNIDWAARTSDIYLNGALILTAWPFRSASATTIDRIHLFNLNAGTAMYDEIIIGAQPLVGSELSTICANDSIVVNGTTYNAGNPSGTEVFTNVGANGCDSTVTVSLNVLPELTGFVNNTICYSDSVIVNGNVYNASTPSGTEVFANMGANGCDSTVTISLTVEQAIDTAIDTTSSPTLSASQSGVSYQWIDCDNGNAAIIGETNQSFTASINGNYAVEITVGSCSETSACKNVTEIVGLDETSKIIASIFPNPSSGLFTISLNNKGGVSYTISTIEGKIIQTGEAMNDNFIIDLENERKGIYFIKIRQANTSNLLKLVTQ